MQMHDRSSDACLRALNLSVRLRVLLALPVGATLGYLIGLILDIDWKWSPHYFALIGTTICAASANNGGGHRWFPSVALILVPVMIGVAIFWPMNEMGPSWNQLPSRIIALYLTAGAFAGGMLSAGVTAILAAFFDPPVALPTDGPVRCDGCGREALHPAQFRAEPGSASVSKQLCVRCRDQRQKKLVGQLLLTTGGLALAGAVLTWLDTEFGAGAWLLNCALLVGFLIVLAVPHEFAHAVAAWLVGARVFNIYLGYGVNVFRDGKWGWMPETQRPARVNPMAVFGFPQFSHLRLRLFLITLAGPLIHGIFLGLALLIRPASDMIRDITSVTPAVLPIVPFAVANLIALVGNLIPRRTLLTGARTDGWTLLAAPFLSDEFCRQVHGSYFAHQGDVCLRDRQLTEAHEWFERGLAPHPDDLACMFGLGRVVLREGRPADARAVWQPLLPHRHLTPPGRIAIRDALATADLLMLLQDPDRTDRAELLEEADRLTQETLADAHLLPDHIPSLMGTRGGTLMELGRDVEAADLLTRTLADMEEKTDRAICCCYLALGATRLGDKMAAKQHLAEARSLDPEGAFVQAIDRSIGGAGLACY